MAEDNNQNKQGKKEIPSDETVVTFACFGGEIKLGTLKNNEVFDYYKKLTGPQTMPCVCRDIVISIETHKEPGDDQQHLNIRSGFVRHHPLCFRNDTEKKIDSYCDFCTDRFKTGNCPDLFMQALGRKFFPDKYKDDNQR